jgi:hypothetical protein
MSVHLSVRACFGVASIRKFSVICGIGTFMKLPVEKIHMRLKLEILGPFHEDMSIFQIIGCDTM